MILEFIIGAVVVVGGAATLIEDAVSKGKEIHSSIEENGFGETIVDEGKKAYDAFSKTVHKEYERMQKEQERRERANKK